MNCQAVCTLDPPALINRQWGRLSIWIMNSEEAFSVKVLFFSKEPTTTARVCLLHACLPCASALMLCTVKVKIEALFKNKIIQGWFLFIQDTKLLLCFEDNCWFLAFSNSILKTDLHSHCKEWYALTFVGYPLYLPAWFEMAKTYCVNPEDDN